MRRKLTPKDEEKLQQAELMNIRASMLQIGAIKYIEQQGEYIGDEVLGVAINLLQETKSLKQQSQTLYNAVERYRFKKD